MPSRPLAIQFALLLVLAVILGSAANLFILPKDDRLAWVEDWGKYVEAKAVEAGITLVDLGQVRDIIDQRKHMVFDARPTVDFDAGHLPGAISLPYQDVEFVFQDVMILLTPETPILTYCSGEECDESLQISEFLLEQGFTNIVLFAGGYNAWEAGGLPTE